MKHLLFLLACVGMMFTFAPQGYAKTTGPEPKSASSETKAASSEKAAPKYKTNGKTSVPRFIRKTKFMNGKPSTKADYYIYYYSASWCKPCQKIMPGVVREYPNLKAANVEVILMCCDRTEVKAKAYIEEHKMKFACMMSTDPKAKELPGMCKVLGIPSCILVTADGQLVKNASGGGFITSGNWRKYIAEFEESQKEKQEEDTDSDL